MTLTVSKVLLIVACILFAVASLAAGGVITGVTAWAFGFGGLAAWALAAAV